MHYWWIYYKMVREVLTTLKIWWSLVETYHQLLQKNHHGAPVGFVDQCHMKRKTSVAGKLDVWRRMLPFKIHVQTAMFWLWQSEADVTFGQMNQTIRQIVFAKAAYRQYILWRYKKLGRGNRKVVPSCVVIIIIIIIII
jgi:hypothetical protein